MAQLYTSSFYRRSPIWLQETMLSWRGQARTRLREGSSFRRLLAEIGRSERLSASGIEQYQLAALKRLLVHAGENIPYYRDLFASHGFQPATFRDVSQLGALPILRKQDVARFYPQLTWAKHRGLKIQRQSSGTTGPSVSLCGDLAETRREHAFIFRQLLWAGFSPGEKRAWFRGDMVVPVAAERPPFWRFNAAENMLMMSSYHLSEEHCPAYLQALRTFDPVLIQAYPSSIAYIARWLWNRGMEARIRSLRAIVTSSETVPHEQRECIETVFGTRVFDWYGAAERVGAIGTCERGNYHIISDYGFVELVPCPDGVYEIIATGFGNFLMPLIRYGTGDYVTPADPSECCPCGRAFPLVRNVWGRMDDLVQTPDGRQVGGCLHGWVFDGILGISEAQIVQKHLRAIEIRVVPSGELKQSTRQHILAQAKERLGDKIEITITEVPKIERSRNGKLRNVVSEISG